MGDRTFKCSTSRLTRYGFFSTFSHGHHHSFSAQTPLQNSKKNPLTCGIKLTGVGKICTFKCSITHAKTILSQRSMLFLEKLSSEEGILERVKKQMYTMFVVWTRMLYFAKKFCEIVRLCCRTIPNEII